MHPQPVFRRVFLIPVLGVALIALVAACGGGTSSSKSSASPKATTSAAASPTSASPASGSGAEAQIKSNWSTFFNAKTPNSQRVKLLQNGTEFAPVLEAQSKSPMASEASAEVTKVTVTSPEQAQVSYSLLVGGKPALSNQKGAAVKQGGTWKVSDQSFCALLTMENGGKTSGLPKACQGASAKTTK